MNIAAKLVKELREKTGAGILECKKALVEVGGKIEEAADYLRKKGVLKAAKKQDRVTAEGLSIVHTEGKSGVLIEVNSETDFVSKNEKFQQLVREIAQVAFKNNCQDIQSLENLSMSNGGTVKDEINNSIAVIGENITLRRISNFNVKEGVISSYIHNATGENIGQIGVLVALESDCSDHEKLKGFGQKIAMHIAATRPISLAPEGVDPDVIQTEKDIFIEQSRSSGKAEEIISKMIHGKMQKFFGEHVLLEQVYILDNDYKVKEIVQKFGKDNNCNIRITNFERYKVGEDIKSAPANFVDEVVAMTK